MPIQQTVGLRDDTNLPAEQTLARISFGKFHQITDDPRMVTIGLPSLETEDMIECWQAMRPVKTGHYEEIAFASDGRFVFGHLLLEEAQSTSLEVPAYHAYISILNCLKALGGLHLLRIWNYLDAINEDQAGLERYRSFCLGRSRAFADRGFADQALPAASGVGASAPGLMISFLAATGPGCQIENPRQVSAFQYPEQYGPRSPSFSRALIYSPTAECRILFISGTASIVGHETMHPGDLMQQFDETCRNIDAIRAETFGQPELQALRLYIRNEDQAEALITKARQHFGEQLPIIPLKSNICRKDLLLEIEGLASASPSSQRIA